MFKRIGLWAVILIAAAILYVLKRPEHSRAIRVGVILSLTGKMANYGQTSLAALQAMNEELNLKRKEQGYPPIELIIEDDRLDPKTGVAAARKLIETDRVAAIIGPMGSSVTLAAAPVAEARKTVLISPASAAASISKAGDYIFRTIVSGEYEARASAGLYNHHYPGRKLAVMYINNEYGQSLRREFTASARAEGILEVPYSDQETDFRSYLTKIKTAGAEVVYIAGYNEMPEVFRQAGELGLGVKWIGAGQMGNQSLIARLGSSADGIIFPTWDLDIDKIKNAHPQFYGRYQRYAGSAALDPFAANAADALSVLHAVIGEKARSGEEIKTALYGIRDFEGLSGKFSFDANGDVQRELVVKTIATGEVVDLK